MIGKCRVLEECCKHLTEIACIIGISARSGDSKVGFSTVAEATPEASLIRIAAVRFWIYIWRNSGAKIRYIIR